MPLSENLAPCATRGRPERPRKLLLLPSDLCSFMESMSDKAQNSTDLVYIDVRRSDDGHWSASFRGHPEVSFGGNTALVAAERLVHAAIGFDTRTLQAVAQAGEGHRAEFAVLRTAWSVCSDCGGTGQYVGLAAVEGCRACSGSGQSR